MLIPVAAQTVHPRKLAAVRREVVAGAVGVGVRRTRQCLLGRALRYAPSLNVMYPAVNAAGYAVKSDEGYRYWTVNVAVAVLTAGPEAPVNVMVYVPGVVLAGNSIPLMASAI